MPARAGERRTAVPTARGLAIEVLAAVDAGERANAALDRRLRTAHLVARDRAFATELVYGTERRRAACDWLIGQFLPAGRRLQRPVRAALRVGAYQLAFLGTPAHAAVSATVAEIGGSGRGMVNAILRRVAQLVASGPVSWPDRATELSYPGWLVDRLVDDLGADPAFGALEAMNRSVPVTVRADGYAQDRASQLVAAHVGAVAGERVADVCAAPGGKATAMAASGAWVLAGDVDPERAGLARINADRLRPRGEGQGGTVAVIAADGRQPPLRSGTFDRVLVDAPCSGLGTLRRRPDARWRIHSEDIDRLAKLQQELLAATLPLVRPGGVMAYSVCTLTCAETIAVDRWLATCHPDWHPLAPPGPPWQPAGRGALLLPQEAGTDGMFLLTARRKPMHAD